MPRRKAKVIPNAPLCSTEGCDRLCYAKGMCSAHYMADRRAKDKEQEAIMEADPSMRMGKDFMKEDPLDYEQVDRISGNIAADDFSSFLENNDFDTDQPSDTPARKELREWARSHATYYRQKFIRQLIMYGLDDEEIIVRMLTNEAVARRYIDSLPHPRRTLMDDFKAIRAALAAKTPRANRVDASMQYEESLEAMVRRAESDSRNLDLSLTDRTKSARSLETLARNLAIMRGAIHVVPGRGDMPKGSPRGDDDFEDEYDDDGDEEYKLPNVRRKEDMPTEEDDGNSVS